MKSLKSGILAALILAVGTGLCGCGSNSMTEDTSKPNIEPPSGEGAIQPQNAPGMGGQPGAGQATDQMQAPPPPPAGGG